jgi:hypothetical protein
MQRRRLRLCHQWVNSVPNYAVLYKTEADPDGRLWPVGPFPDRNFALDIFNNSTGREQNIGPFTFEETSDYLPIII